METLEELIHPCTWSAFAADYWERKYLHVGRNDPEYFRSIFTIEDLDGILARDDLRFPAIKVFVKGEQLPLSAYSRSWYYGHNKFNDLLDIDRVLKFYDQGATLNILSLERLSAGVAKVNHGMESDSGFPVHTTAFLTPRDANNIPAHFDMVDFFVLQISGTKRWQIWASDTGMPLVQDRERIYDPGHPAISNENLLLDVMLNSGDTLFVPRGLIHGAITSADHSLHLTVGINPVRRWDLVNSVLSDIVRELKNSLDLRRALPVPSNSEPELHQTVAHNQLQSLVDLHSENLDDRIHEAFQQQSSYFVASRYPSRPGQLVSRTENKQIHSDDRFRRRPNVVSKFTSSENRIKLEFQDKALSLNSSLRPIIMALLDREAMQLRELPGDWSLLEKASVIERLIREGFVELLPSDDRRCVDQI